MHDAVVDILDGGSVVGMVVPDGEHSALDLLQRVAGKYFASDVGGSPFVVEHLVVEVVVVVAGVRHDIDISVGDGDYVVALFYHILRVSVTIVPAVHQDIV